VKRGVAVLTALALAAVPLAACGSDDDSAEGNTSDRAFLNDMIPHHAMAVDMGGTAKREAEHAEIKQLAASIVASQRDEIALMRRLKGEVDAGDAKSTFGMSMKEMGMAMDMEAFMKARQFDRAFIDDMAPHHRGAIVMAREELAKGKDPQVRALARRIIRAQTAEIDLMNSLRRRWYGRPTRVTP